MTDRRNFLKNAALGATALAIPGIANANVKNWAMMDKPKFYSPICVPSNWQLPQTINKPICPELLTNITVPEEYYKINYQYALKMHKENPDKWQNIEHFKEPSYLYFHAYDPTHPALALKAVDQNYQKEFTVVCGFVVAVKEKDSLKAHDKITTYIKNEIEAHLKENPIENPDHGRLVILQPFQKCDFINRSPWLPNEDRSFKQDGIQRPLIDLVENPNSDVHAIKVGIITFVHNDGKTMT